MTASVTTTTTTARGEASALTRVLEGIAQPEPGLAAAGIDETFASACHEILIAPRGTLRIRVAGPSSVADHRITLARSGALLLSTRTDRDTAEATLFPVAMLPGVLARVAAIAPTGTGTTPEPATTPPGHVDPDDLAALLSPDTATREAAAARCASELRTSTAFPDGPDGAAWSAISVLRERPDRTERALVVRTADTYATAEDTGALTAGSPTAAWRHLASALA